jgi:plasmid stabilization system protein ParE
MRLIVDESAWRDLEHIAHRISADNPPAAQAQIAKIRHAIDQLSAFLQRDPARRDSLGVPGHEQVRYSTHRTSGCG